MAVDTLLFLLFLLPRLAPRVFKLRGPSAELLEALEAKGLESMGADLGLAGIKTITALMMHSIDEIEDSLKRPTVRGAKYRLALLFERKLIIQFAALSIFTRVRGSKERLFRILTTARRHRRAC